MNTNMNLLPSKPKYGQPCNGCGLCCALELCHIADMAFPGAKAPCPALKLTGDGKRTYCELMAIEKAAGMTPIIQASLGAGLGCSMPDPATSSQEPSNQQNRVLPLPHDDVTRDGDHDVWGT